MLEDTKPRWFPPCSHDVTSKPIAMVFWAGAGWGLAVGGV